MKNWPNDTSWHALESGQVTVERMTYDLVVVACGELVMPSGKLVACDPFVYLHRTGNAYVIVPPGRHRVLVTVAEGFAEAYATLLIRSTPEVMRKVLTPTHAGEAIAEPETGFESGFPVDAGTACFVDAEAAEHGMLPTSDNWDDILFDNGTPDSWFSRMDDPHHIRAGIANIPLPLAQNGENIIIFHSGGGDGVYPIIGGYDAKGDLVAIHIDFLLFGND